MASEKASVQISLDGADAVVSDAKKAEQAINSIGSGAVRAGKAVAGSMLGAVGSAMQLAAAATAINFGKGMADAKTLDLTVARLARTAGDVDEAPIGQDSRVNGGKCDEVSDSRATPREAESNDATDSRLDSGDDSLWPHRRYLLKKCSRVMSASRRLTSDEISR